jgi:C1A family cysteine protease
MDMNENLTGLGRRVSIDPRDRDHLLPRAALARAADGITARYWFTPGEAYDQGATSECVAYSTCRFLVTYPIVNKPIEFTPFYKRCQQVDEWPGEDYDGTSVRAAFKILQADGLCTSYKWAFDVETVVNHVLSTGPVVMGTTWFLDMFTPDRHGYITPTGYPVGGHAWTIVGASRTRKNPDGSVGAVRMINSWGPNWGEKGRAWITFRDLQTLIDDYGEACVAQEIKRVA